MLKMRILACLLTLSAIAAAPAVRSQTGPDYATIVAAPDRSDADRKLDTNRAPAQWLAFIGAKPGMKILDIEAVYGWKAELLGRVDGFNQDKGTGEGDKGGEVLRGLLAAQGDTFEALEPSDGLLDTGAPLVEDFGKERGFCSSILAVGDGGADAASARCLAVRLGVVTLVTEHRARRDVGANVEQDLEVAAVAGLAAGQMEGQRQAVEIGLQVDFAGKSAARAPEGLTLLPPFAPAAETWARTTVESTIWTRWAVPLVSAKLASRASKTPRWLSRQNRFHTLFQLPNCAGKARHVML